MIYRIHANLCLYPNIKIYNGISKIKNRTHLSWVDLTFERYEDVKVFRVSLLITNGKKGHLDENYFHHCYGILYYFESYSHDQSFFSTIMRHNGNSISKDILQRFYGHGYVLITSSRLYMTRKSWAIVSDTYLEPCQAWKMERLQK